MSQLGDKEYDPAASRRAAPSMKVQASVKKISSNDKLVWRRPKNRRFKAKLFVINKLRRKNKQRQG